jgi:hypothetical protein
MKPNTRRTVEQVASYRLPLDHCITVVREEDEHSDTVYSEHVIMFTAPPLQLEIV